MNSKEYTRHQRGKIHEKLVLTLIQSLELPWIETIRLATPKEDAQGGDIIIDDIWGKRMFLQVKTQHCDAQRFRKKRRDSNLPFITVVTVDHEKYSPEENLARIKRQFNWNPL